MNKYQLINEGDTLLSIVKLIRNGFLSPTLIRDIRIYDRFQQLEGSKGERYKVLSEEFKLAEITIQSKIINLSKAAK